ncbi:hypothetical protein LMG26411_07944 [Cupriavidus numazuensis]|uniref:DNA-directed RNA polymerase II n=1 Tax=Cupriavidus numazuensis TaxID=221992 RepID=A0ABM8TW81_9BURK|nr:hypothetical protein LMG26411_07944 [Cupriavidus numazuensis]
MLFATLMPTPAPALAGSVMVVPAFPPVPVIWLAVPLFTISPTVADWMSIPMPVPPDPGGPSIAPLPPAPPVAEIVPKLVRVPVWPPLTLIAVAAPPEPEMRTPSLEPAPPVARMLAPAALIRLSSSNEEGLLES